MRIVHICQRDDPNIGGSLRVAEALVLEQRKSGVDAWILFLYGEPGNVARELDPHSVCLQLSSSREAYKGVFALKRAIRDIRPDIIHSHDGILWPRLVYLQLSITVVMHSHLPASRSSNWVVRRLIMNTTDLIVGISLPTIETWIEAGYPREQITYIANGVDFSRFHKVDEQTKLALREKLGLPEEKTIMLWMGRLHKGMKGSERVEQVAQLLPDDTVLVVVGNGPEYEAMLSSNAGLIEAGKMYMIGSVGEPREYYMASDVFLFTSHYEPFGLVILEAVACGLPIMAFPVDQGGGATELLDEFDACIVGDDLSRQKVHEAILEVMSKVDSTDVYLGRAMGKYSWADKSRELMVVYRRVLGMPVPEESVKNRPKILVCQHGARRRYAMPRMIHDAGMLSALYTDSSAESPIGKVVKLLGDSAPEAWKNYSRWDLQGIPHQKIYSSDRSVYLELFQKILLSSKSGIQLYHQRHKVLSARMKRWGLQGADVVYTMYHENLDFVRWAKAQGAFSVVDVFISPITDQIMEQEVALYPEWMDMVEPYIIEFERRLWEETVSLADLLLCPSEWVAEGVRAITPGVANKVRVVPYGCSINYRGRINQPVEGRLLFAGRDPLRKGLQYLAQAATKLKDELPGLDFRIAGNLPDAVRNDPLCKDLNFLGQLDGGEMQEEFLSADMLVLPALSEGFAGVVAEAIGAGCPVIVTQEAGSPIIPGREGLVVSSRDAQALAEAIRFMVTDRKFRDNCARECLGQVDFYSEKVWQERLCQTIQECIADVASRPRTPVAEEMR